MKITASRSRPQQPTTTATATVAARMAHLAYKKPLFEQKVRDKFLAERNDLRRARDAGIIDAIKYKEAKRKITPIAIPLDIDSHGRALPASSRASMRSSGSRSSSGSIPKMPPLPAPKIKGSTILDRNDTMRYYKPDCRTQEDREAARARQRNAHDAQLEAEKDSMQPHLPGIFNPEDLQNWSAVSSAASSKSIKAPSKNQRFSLFSRARRPSAKSKPDDEAPPETPVLTTTLYSPDTRGAGNWERSASVSSSAGSWSRSRKASIATTATMQSSSTSSSAHVDEVQLTWADRIFFGILQPTNTNSNVQPILSQDPTTYPTPRRHSFSSQSPSFPASQNSRRPSSTCENNSSASIYSEGGERDPDPSYGFSSIHEYDEPRYTPPSMMLLEIFEALLTDFGSTSQIFGYAKDHEYRPSCPPSISGSDVYKMHPGHLVVFDDELESIRAAMKKRVWFLMAIKWLYFGRVLFSPGHHLLQLYAEDETRPRTGDELRVLDLDGPALGMWNSAPFFVIFANHLPADWSWQASLEYPESFIHVTTSTGTSHHSPISSFEFLQEYMSPRNHRRTQIPLGHVTLAPLATGSMDVISSRYLPAFVTRDGWLPLMLECQRVLKSDGYLELTILDPVLNDMGPMLRHWILEHTLSDPEHPRGFDIMPSKSVLAALREAGFEEKEINKVWMWMPAVNAGDELSSVTSSIARFLYDELYCPRPEEEEEAAGAPRAHYESEVWSNKAIMEECRQYNTAFRWLKVYVRKSPTKRSVDY